MRLVDVGDTTDDEAPAVDALACMGLIAGDEDVDERVGEARGGFDLNATWWSLEARRVHVVAKLIGDQADASNLARQSWPVELLKLRTRFGDNEAFSGGAKCATMLVVVPPGKLEQELLAARRIRNQVADGPFIELSPDLGCVRRDTRGERRECVIG